MASRALIDLDPRVQDKAREIRDAWIAAGLDVLVTCTYRSYAEQGQLWDQGRTLPGQVVTHAKPGESLHNHKLALDFVPLVAGKPVWDSNSPLWERIARIAQRIDPRIVWGGTWSPEKRDLPHLEWSGNLGSKETGP